MNKRIKKIWLRELRSGVYEQGREKLLQVDEKTGEESFCCLGVLCNIHAEETGGVWNELNRYHDTAGLLPFKVRNWAGLDNADPVVGKHSLSEWNDGEFWDDRKPKTFKQIANLIEKYL